MTCTLTSTDFSLVLQQPVSALYPTSDSQKAQKRRMVVLNNFLEVLAKKLFQKGQKATHFSYNHKFYLINRTLKVLS